MTDISTEPGEDRDPLDVYERLQKAAPAQKTDIVLDLIEKHPQGRLELPERDGIHADLSGVDLSTDVLKDRLIQLHLEGSVWWYYGPPSAGANLEGADLRGANLDGVKLQGANLMYAKLQDTSLVNANLESAVLAGADLQHANLTEANLEGAYLIGANLQCARLARAKLRHATLYEPLIESPKYQWELAMSVIAKLNREHISILVLPAERVTDPGTDAITLPGTDAITLLSADLRDADLRGAELQEVDLSTCRMERVFISKARLEKTMIRREQLGGKIGEEVDAENKQVFEYRPGVTVAPLPTYQYREAKHGYLALKQNFDALGDYEGASWAYRKERRMRKFEALYAARDARRKHHWRTAVAEYCKYLTDQCVVEWVCDYGESVGRVLLTLLAAFISFTLLYGLIGLDPRNGGTAVSLFVCHPLSPLTCKALPAILADLGLYSLGAMTTMGPTALVQEGLQIHSLWFQWLPGFQALVSVGLTGLLGFVVGNRIRRS